MSRESESGVLRVGVLTLNRNYMVSPNLIAPEFFTAPYERETSVSIGNQAIALLGERGLVTTALHSLIPLSSSQDRGYLLREISPHDTQDQDFGQFSRSDVMQFTANYPPDDIRGHFLRQVLYHMRPRGHLSGRS